MSVQRRKSSGSAVCRECGRKVATRPDGSLVAHRARGGAICKGSHKP